MPSWDCTLVRQFSPRAHPPLKNNCCCCCWWFRKKEARYLQKKHPLHALQPMKRLSRIHPPIRLCSARVVSADPDAIRLLRLRRAGFRPSSVCPFCTPPPSHFFDQKRLLPLSSPVVPSFLRTVQHRRQEQRLLNSTSLAQRLGSHRDCSAATMAPLLAPASGPIAFAPMLVLLFGC